MSQIPAEPTASGIRFASVSETETTGLAARIAGIAAAGDVLALDGPLGAGKTAFARGFIRALTRPDEDVPSPTFTLVQLYDAGPIPIYHFDLYRIEDAAELDELGLEEAFADGITLIEWPEIARGLETDRWLHVRFALDTTDPRARAIALVPGPAWRDRLVPLMSAQAGQAHD